jgi:bifunctional N6-L-threonylcarbamoyladenine synthase / protein kinase Bud32
VTLVLALDTSTEELAVGLGFLREGGMHLAGETNLDVPRASLTHLVPSITRLLESADIDLRDVDAVVVGRGPGSFTGVRIVVAAAKGIAQGLGVPLYGVGTLDAVAERFAGRDGLVCVVGDAMRREVYPALFRCAGGAVERLTSDAVSTPAAAAETWAALPGPLLLAGNGLRKYERVFLEALGEKAELCPEPMWAPTGESLLVAAWRSWKAGTLGDGDVATVLPVYTRLSDAEEAEAARRGETVPAPSSGVAGPPSGGEASS